MKILLCIDKNPLLANDGLTIIILNWLTILSKQHEIFVVTVQPHGNDQELFQTHFPRITLLDWAALSDKETETSPSPVFNKFDRKIIDYYGFNYKLHSAIAYYHQSHSFDTVITFGLWLTAYTFNLKNTITVCHAIDDPLTHGWPKQHSLLRKLKTLKITFIAMCECLRFGRKHNMLLTVTDENSNALHKYTRHPNIVTIKNGVDIDTFKPSTEGDIPAVIFTGTMNYPPNIEAVQFFTQEVWPIIQQTNHNAQFWIVGRDPTQEVLALATEENNIVVTGEVANIADSLAKAWVSVAPMVVGTGIKNKTLEAWAMAKPVVTTTIATQGLKTLPDQNCFIRDSTTEIASCINKLLSSKPLREEMGSKARETVEQHYLWHSHVEKLINAINERKKK